MFLHAASEPSDNVSAFVKGKGARDVAIKRIAQDRRNFLKIAARTAGLAGALSVFPPSIGVGSFRMKSSAKGISPFHLLGCRAENAVFRTKKPEFANLKSGCQSHTSRHPYGQNIQMR